MRLYDVSRKLASTMVVRGEVAGEWCLDRVPVTTQRSRGPPVRRESVWDDELREHIKRGDPNAEETLRDGDVISRERYLATYWFDGRTFEEVRAEKLRGRPNLMLVSDA